MSKAGEQEAAPRVRAGQRTHREVADGAPMTWQRCEQGRGAWKLMGSDSGSVRAQTDT